MITCDRLRSGAKLAAPGTHVLGILMSRPRAAPQMLPAIQMMARTCKGKLLSQTTSGAGSFFDCSKRCLGQLLCGQLLWACSGPVMCVDGQIVASLRLLAGLDTLIQRNVPVIYSILQKAFANSE